MTTTKKLFIGDSYDTLKGRRVTVRSIVSNSIAKVSWGFDSNGNDILGLLLISELIQK